MKEELCIEEAIKQYERSENILFSLIGLMSKKNPRVIDYLSDITKKFAITEFPHPCSYELFTEFYVDHFTDCYQSYRNAFTQHINNLKANHKYMLEVYSISNR